MANSTDEPKYDASSATFLLISLCFLLSGFAALLYETVWLRQFAIVFGTSEQALAIVLSTYMGGLAIGSVLAAKFADRIKRPLLAYGFLEMGIAVGALLVPLGLSIAKSIQFQICGGSDPPPGAGEFAQVLFFFVSAFAVTIIPTALMGATLPLLARHVVRSDEHLGKRVGALYAINVVGAVLGTLTAAFVALPAVGLQATVWIGASVNLVVFLLVVLISRMGTGEGLLSVSTVDSELATSGVSAERSVDRSMDQAAGKANGKSSKASTRRNRRSDARASAEPIDKLMLGTWILPIIAVSGGLSFAYEILFTRMLGHVLGGSLFAFASMLASFLSGIAIGAAIASRFASSTRTAAQAMVFVQLGIALLAMASWYGVEHFAASINAAFLEAETYSIPRWLVATFILLPPAIAIGMTFPLAIRIHARDHRDAAYSSASVYAWNTLGSVTGAFLSGTYLLPATDYALMLVIVAVANILLALAVALNVGLSLRPVAAVIATAAALAFAFPSLPEELLRTSLIKSAVRQGMLKFVTSGRSSTVTVHYNNGIHTFSTNGLPEAGAFPQGWVADREMAVYWMGVLPAAILPEAESMCVIGFGSGKAATSAPPWIRDIDVFELEEGVIEGNRLVSKQRWQRPLADPRINVILNDGRNGLAMTSKNYDIVVSQPSHPWTAGASHLYSREFAELVRGRLTPNGLFVLWVDSTLVSYENFLGLGATLLDVFGDVQLYQTSATTHLYVASPQASEPTGQSVPALRSELFANNPMLQQLGLDHEGALRAVLSLDHNQISQLCEGVPPITDNNNRMALQGRQMTEEDVIRGDLQKAVDAIDPLTKPESNMAGNPDLGYIARQRHSLGRFANAAAIIDSIPNQGQQLFLRASLQFEANQWDAARSLLIQAIGADADQVESIGLLQFIATQTKQPITELPADAVDVKKLPSRYQAIVSAANQLSEGRFDEMPSLDLKLASFDGADPLLNVALQLRMEWRTLDSERPARDRGREIMGLVDRLIGHRRYPRVMPLRILGARMADEPSELLASVQLLLQSLIDPRNNYQSGAGSPAFAASQAERVAKLRLLQPCGQALAVLEQDKRIDKVRWYEVSALFQRLQQMLSMPAPAG